MWTHHKHTPIHTFVLSINTQPHLNTGLIRLLVTDSLSVRPTCWLVRQPMLVLSTDFYPPVKCQSQKPVKTSDSALSSTRHLISNLVTRPTDAVVEPTCCHPSERSVNNTVNRNETAAGVMGVNTRPPSGLL